MKEWLRKKGIQFVDTMLNPDQYSLIKIQKSRYKMYKIDNIMENRGHNLLQLPPYYPDHNPIEMVWSLLLHHVSKYNVNFNFSDEKKLGNQFVVSFNACGRKFVVGNLAVNMQ